MLYGCTMKVSETPKTFFWPLPQSSSYKRGALGFFILRIWPSFGLVFRFSHLKAAVFRFWCLVRFAHFFNLVFGFRFLPTVMTVFLLFFFHYRHALKL